MRTLLINKVACNGSVALPRTEKKTVVAVKPAIAVEYTQIGDTFETQLQVMLKEHV